MDLKRIKFEEIPDYGDVMTIEDWLAVLVQVGL